MPWWRDSGEIIMDVQQPPARSQTFMCTRKSLLVPIRVNTAHVEKSPCNTHPSRVTVQLTPDTSHTSARSGDRCPVVVHTCDHTCVSGVGKAFLGLLPSIGISGLTRLRKPTSASNVGKPSSTTQVSPATREATLERSPINAWNARKPSASPQPSVDT